MRVMHTMNPSKTDHIMSRYRPIAPKPTQGGSTDQTDSLSSLSVDNNKSAEYCHRGKRRNSSASNKRAAPEASKSSPRNVKKRSSGSGKSSGGVEGNVEFQPPSFNLTPIFSEQVAPVFGPGGLQRFKDSFDHGVSVALSLAPKPSADHYDYLHSDGVGVVHSTLQCSKDGLSFNIASSPSRAVAAAPDMGFMERAALNATHGVEHPNSGRSRMPFYSSFSNTSFSEVCSEDVATAPESRNIVTLSLLPDTPSCVNTRSSTSSTSTLSLLRSDIRWSSTDQARPATTTSDLNTSLTMSSWSEVEDTSIRAERASQQDHSGMVVVDAHDLEQRHGGSSEAVILTDERDAVLWVNSAFQRLSNERMSSRMQAIGPHIDPLGIRTKLAVLTFQPPFPAPTCKAILWGFLKKFIMHEGTGHEAKVIAPQPLRAVGSTITVQSIDTMNPNAYPLAESYETVQESLNKGEMPSVITDLRFRVRWVNTAYKRLVGQPKCSWLATTVGDDEAAAAAIPHRLAGDVSLICDGMALPEGVPAFTCRVGIQWSHQGEHSAMSVPSQVARLDDDSYVWRFDVCDAGVKNVLQIETAATSPFC